MQILLKLYRIYFRGGNHIKLIIKLVHLNGDTIKLESSSDGKMGRVCFASLRSDKLNLIQKIVTDYEAEQEIKPTKLHALKLSKDPQKDSEEIKSELLKAEGCFDALVIIHKIELRTLLLGNNGFYNHVVESQFFNLRNELLIKYIGGKIAFVLLYSSIRDNDIQASVNRLIEKGGQEELKFFVERNLIFFFDEDLGKFDDCHFWDFIHFNRCILKPSSSFYEVFVNNSQRYVCYDRALGQLKQKLTVEAMPLPKGKEVLEQIVDDMLYPEKRKSVKCFIL